MQKHIQVLAVGVVQLDKIKVFIETDAAGFGGGSLHKPGNAVAAVAEVPRELIAAVGDFN